MAIITLTTDLGLTDFYVASIKGKILSLCPEAKIVDVSHNIPHFDISNAAFCLKNCYADFPKGSIHIIGVSTISGNKHNHLLVYHNEHYFISADNGIFSLLFDDEIQTVYAINLPEVNQEFTFPTKDLYTVIAAQLANQLPMNQMTSLGKINIEKSSFKPVIETNSIRGMAIYIDSMFNITTNISKKMFEEIGGGRNFEIVFRRSEYSIKNINQNYNEVPEGENVALFNHNHHLEIAINKGAASKLLGIKQFDTIRIDFK
jgi:S-adenosylmethionine hydrolase